MQIELQHITPLFVGALTLVNGWLIWLVAEGKRERSISREEVRIVVKELSEFKEKVARENVTMEMLAKVEERVITAIDRLADRLDRAFEARRKE